MLIGCLSLVGIGAVIFVGPLLSHGSNLDHNVGKIAVIDTADTTFVLITENNQRITFQCGDERCRVQLAHMQRHKLIQALTDVYYKPVMAKKVLLAMDVD